MMAEEERRSDEELICQIRQGDAGAMEVLLERYKQLVRKQAAFRYLAGGDTDDLIQEGMIGLYRAVLDFDPEKAKGAPFGAFAYLCIKGQINKAIARSQSSGNQAMNQAVGMDEENLEQYYKKIQAIAKDPETLLLEDEKRDELLEKIRRTLTKTERKVFDIRLQGYGYREIAEALDMQPKSVDNALQRIRKKGAKVLEG